MNAVIAAVLCVVAAWAPRPAGASEAPERWSVNLSTGASYVTDRSLDPISGTDAMATGELRLGFSPGWLSGRLELDAAYARDGAGTTTFESWQTSLSTQSLELGALYRLPVWTWLRVYGRAAGLVDFDHLALATDDDSDDAPPAEQTTTTFGVLGALGAEGVLVRARSFELGLTLEVGYALRFDAAHFDRLMPDAGSSNPAPIAFAPVDAGSVGLSGIQWRLGVAFRF